MPAPACETAIVCSSVQPVVCSKPRISVGTNGVGLSERRDSAKIPNRISVAAASRAPATNSGDAFSVAILIVTQV